MPAAWQTRNAPAMTTIPGHDGQPGQTGVRNFADVALDPLRWLTATTPRKIGALVIVGSLLLKAFS